MLSLFPFKAGRAKLSNILYIICVSACAFNYLFCCVYSYYLKYVEATKVPRYFTIVSAFSLICLEFGSYISYYLIGL